MSDETFEVLGLKELDEALQLPTKIKAQLYKSANRKAVNEVVVKPLRAHLSYSTRSEKGIKVLSFKDETKTAVTGGLTSDSYWLRWPDKGTKERYTKKGAYKGSISARDQIQPFIENKVPEVIDFARDEYGNIILKSMERKLKRLNK